MQDILKHGSRCSQLPVQYLFVSQFNYFFCYTLLDTPSQRVQFILGMEEDEEHVPHDLFTEMDEICIKEGEDAEWKEAAR